MTDSFEETRCEDAEDLAHVISSIAHDAYASEIIEKGVRMAVENHDVSLIELRDFVSALTEAVERSNS